MLHRHSALGVATTGVASTFSFYPTKNLGGIGDGGLVATLEDEIAERVRLLRFHGSRDKRDFLYVGTNSGSTSSGGGFAALPRAPRRLERAAPRGGRALCRAGARRARRAAAGRRRTRLPPLRRRLSERDRIADALATAEIGSASYYKTPLHLQPALGYLGWRPGSLPETERAARENLALPMWAGIDADTQERVVEPCAEPSPSESRRDQPAPHLAAARGRGLIVGAWYLAFRCVSTRRGSRRTTRTCSGGRCRSSSSCSWRSSFSSASTTAGGATSPHATCGRLCAASPSRASCPASSSTSSPRSSRSGCPARSRSWTGCCCSRSWPALACSPGRSSSARRRRGSLRAARR